MAEEIEGKKEVGQSKERKMRGGKEGCWRRRVARGEKEEMSLVEERRRR